MLSGSQWVFTSWPSLSKRGEAVHGSAEARPCGPESRLLQCLWELALPSWHRSHLFLTQNPPLQEWPGMWGGGICPRPSCPGWAGEASPPLGPQPPWLASSGPKEPPTRLGAPHLSSVAQAGPGQNGATFWGKGNWRAALATLWWEAQPCISTEHAVCTHANTKHRTHVQGLPSWSSG